MKTLLLTTALAVALALLAGCPRPSPPALVHGPSTPLEAPRVVAGDLDAHVILGDLPDRATKLGAGPASIVASGEASENERFGAFVEIPQDACLLAYARGSSSIDDIDVVAFTEDGNPLASDQQPDAHPTIVICPPHPDRVYLSLQDASGEGLVALAAQVVPRERASEIARVLGARGARGEGPRPAEAWPGLDDHVRFHRNAIGGTWEEFRRVAVSLDARATTNVGFPMEANQCVDVIVVPDEDVALIEVEALDGEGRVVARAHEGLRDRAITLCSPVAFQGALLLRPHVGSGYAAVVLSRARAEVARDLSGKAQLAWVASPLPLADARSARNADLAKAGYVPPTQTLNGQLTLGRRATLAVDLPANAAAACSRVDVVGGAPLALVDALAWDTTGAALLAHGEGSASATLFMCGHPKAHLELEALGRPGPFTVLVRPERWKDPLFAAHAIAAGRMLARAATGPSMVHEGVPQGVKTFALDPARRVSYGLTVAPSQCVRVAAGGEGEGSGIELRLFDAGTQEEIDRSVAEHAVSARACATLQGPRNVRVELRATSGRMDLVVGERIAP